MVELKFTASASSGEVSAMLLLPAEARALLVLAHGAGAGMRHPFMASVSVALAARAVGTFRYQFPYIEKSGRRPDPQPILLATVRSAVNAARAHASDVPLFAGGKSMGGRMTSLAAAAEPLESVRGIVFLGFPLHPAGKPSVDRAAHLRDTQLPLLFLQGTRDSLADLELLTPVIGDLGGRAFLSIVDGADHGFHVRRSTGRSDADVIEELADRVISWMKPMLGRS